MMKRISALAIALIMIFALSSMAFAQDLSVNTRATDGTRTNSTNMAPGTTDGNMTPGNNVPGRTPDNTFNRMNTNNNFYNNDGTNGVNDGVRDRNDIGVRDPDRGLTTNNLRTRATTTNGMGWGWLGILGLIGLAGMSGRNRVADRDR